MTDPLNSLPASNPTIPEIRAAWMSSDTRAQCGRIPDSQFIHRLVQLYTTICFPQVSEGFSVPASTLAPPLPGDQTESDGLENRVEQLRQTLASLIGWSLTQPDRTREVPDSRAAGREAQQIAQAVIERIPHTIRILQTDLDAAMNGDPACRSREEVLICYPGFRAILVYRIAHQLYTQDAKLAARVLAEWVHGQTGIDIHPGATIGHHFFIDHGTGVVIGETCQVGNHVRLYQGVTLGALNFPRLPSGELVRDNKRHPTIGDGVVIYANAAVLGGETVIGDRSLIGSSVWLTESVPPETRVVMEKPRLKMRSKQNPAAGFVPDYQI